MKGFELENLKRQEEAPWRLELIDAGGKICRSSLPCPVYGFISWEAQGKGRNNGIVSGSWVKSAIANFVASRPDRKCRSTLFVSNLPYTATSTDLQTLFSDIAPVRSAFVVLEQGTGVSKGVGYVSFAIKEDAESAFESKDALVLDGRKLRLQWADTKVRNLELFLTRICLIPPSRRRAR